MPCSSLKTKNWTAQGWWGKKQQGLGPRNNVLMICKLVSLHGGQSDNCCTSPSLQFFRMKRQLKKWYLTFFPLVYHIFPLVLKCYCKVKPNTSGGYCNHIANNMHYNRVCWGIDRFLIRRHHFCQVRISVDYKSYHADQKLLEKVSNLSKLSLINLTYSRFSLSRNQK